AEMGARSGVAVDLGTVNTLVHLAGQGIVLDEPSAIAVDRVSGKVVAVGLEADQLFGRAPVDVEVVHPLRDGVISDLAAATEMLQGFLRRARFHKSALRPRAILCAPSCATVIEREALVAAAAFSRRLEVRLVDEPVAAALSAGAGEESTDGVFVLDVGGGTTEAAVVVGPRMVAYRSLRLGGNTMDEAVETALRRGLGLRVGRKDAERLKIQLGLTGGEHASAVVAGLDVASGSLREIEVEAAFVSAALERAVAAIVGSVVDLLSEIPPGLAKEVIGRGVQMAGGGALLPGLAARIEKESGVGTVVVDDPLRAVVRGASRVLEEGFGSLGKTA
ncbi:MAG: rod shape-determining protein, partial [Nitrososphaerales archaeon]